MFFSSADIQTYSEKDLVKKETAQNDGERERACGFFIIAPNGENIVLGKRGKFIMYPGPLGNNFVKREFSRCSKNEVKIFSN